MIDFKNFMISLKSSWIRRLLFSQSNWTKLFESQFGYSLQTIINLGIYFIDILIKKPPPIPSGLMSSLAGKLFLRPLKIPVVTKKCFMNTCGLIQK